MSNPEEAPKVLDITIRVASSPFNLEQIAMVAVHNTGAKLSNLTVYDVYVDGRQVGSISHNRDDGALALAELALAFINDTEPQL